MSMERFTTVMRGDSTPTQYTSQVLQIVELEKRDRETREAYEAMQVRKCVSARAYISGRDGLLGNGMCAGSGTLGRFKRERRGLVEWVHARSARCGNKCLEGC